MDIYLRNKGLIRLSFSVFVIFAISIGFILGGGLAGCKGGGGTPAAGDDDDDSGTETQAQTAVTASLNMTLAAMSAAESIDTSALVLKAPQALAIQSTATPVDSCEDTNITVPSGDASGTAALTGSVGGSCTVTLYEEDGSEIITIVCTDYDNGDGAVLDGTILISMADSSEEIGASDLQLTFADGTSCAATLNVTSTSECSEGTTTLTASACVTVCGVGFTVETTATMEGECGEEGGSICSEENPSIEDLAALFGGSCTFTAEDMQSNQDPEDSDTFGYDVLEAAAEMFNLTDDDVSCVLRTGYCDYNETSGCMTSQGVEQTANDCGILCMQESPSLTDLEPLFDGTCTYTSIDQLQGEPADTETLNYDAFYAIATTMMSLTDDQVSCVLKIAYCSLGDTAGCLTVSSFESVESYCGIEGIGGGSDLYHVTYELCQQQGGGWPICSEDPVQEDEAFTVDLASAAEVFKLYVDYEDRQDQGEDISGLQYWIGAIEENRTCNGDCWSGPDVSSCNGQSVCEISVTGQNISAFLTARGKDDEFDNNQCVDMWWEWDLNGIDTNFDSDGFAASQLLHLRVQKSNGICN